MKARNQHLGYKVDPIFQGVKILFVLSFKNDAYQRIYRRYFLLAVEIRHYNVMINGKNVSDQPVKNDL